ncbi:hypothetical protein [Rheinheimera sp. MMS21-TC3]|uniref:hypothetical protein n=1 Tax=Rheinheimera sp. MMS21-TC3 TaxID=3072790 RepID=UPI0028C3D261|nr:hypothetical protein [Rheinheimera sp. MMS21-TC3]WNO62137.1 hypothetical protein RDV63_14615 [Rheinheimera sp. MMS21-TC3]
MLPKPAPKAVFKPDFDSNDQEWFQATPYNSDSSWLAPTPFTSGEVWPEPPPLSSSTVWFTAHAHNSRKLLAQSHVCNTESEVSRLAENERLQEMAKALVEFKATKYCFILTAATNIHVLEQHPKYLKFISKARTLYTFNKYLE